MARRDVIRLGLFPDLDYYQPPNLLDDDKETFQRACSNDSKNNGQKRRMGPSSLSSSRTISPSEFSSRDMQDEVMTFLKRRYTIRGRRRLDRQIPATTANISNRILDKERMDSSDHEFSSPVGMFWKSRKRTMADVEKSNVGNVQDEPKTKSARVEEEPVVDGIVMDMVTGTVPTTQYSRNGSRSFADSGIGTDKRKQRSFGLLESDEVEFDNNGKIDNLFPDSIEFNGNDQSKNMRLRPIYGPRFKIRRYGGTDLVKESQNQEDVEEREEAIATFKAGQEYERKKVTSWMQSITSSKNSSNQPSILQPIGGSVAIGISFALPAITTTPPTITQCPSSSAFVQMTTAPNVNGSTVTLASSVIPPTSSLAPVTAVTWTNSLAPIVAVQPLISTTKSSTNVVNEINRTNGGIFQPPATSRAPVSSSADISVNVTMPLPTISTSMEEPSTSMTFRLPTKPTIAASTSSNQPMTTSGFDFTFAGQPPSTGQFNFANTLDPSTNVFSAVGSTQNIARRKPASSSSLYSSRRRHR